jgi:hypothetical protein
MALSAREVHFSASASLGGNRAAQDGNLVHMTVEAGNMAAPDQPVVEAGNMAAPDQLVVMADNMAAPAGTLAHRAVMAGNMVVPG